MNKVVYRHLKPNGEVFYIGIGDSKRAHSKKGRSQFWRRIVDKYGYEVQVLKENLTWEDACELECILIDYYGRRDLGLGNLVNLTDGGEGAVNPSEETRKKMSDAKKGFTPWNKGIPTNIIPWNKGLTGYMGANETSFTKDNIPWNVGNKGHQPNQFTKLTEQQVLEIRSKFKPYKYTRKMLALEYNVAETTIKDIVLRKSWTHI